MSRSAVRMRLAAFREIQVLEQVPLNDRELAEHSVAVVVRLHEAVIFCLYVRLSLSLSLSLSQSVSFSVSLKVPIV